MAHWLAGRIRQQVLLRYVGDVFGLRVLREQMVERLVLVRTDLGRDRLVPFLGVVEFGIDVEHDAAEREQAVADHLTDLELGVARLAHVLEIRPQSPHAPARIHSEPTHRLSHVLDLRRLRETMADELAPLLEIGGVAEVDRMVFHSFPFDEEPVAAGMLDRALQFHPLAALRAPEDRRGLGYAGFEFRFRPGFQFDQPKFDDHNDAPISPAISGSFAATSRARSTTTLACFQVASSCILPSIMTTPVPSGMASRIFFANATSAGSGENTRLAIAICEGCSVQAPAQPMRKALRNCASQASGSAKSPNGP